MNPHFHSQLVVLAGLFSTAADRERIEASVRHALEQARASLEDARRSILELRASPFEGKNLAEALANAGSHAAASNLSVTLGAAADGVRLVISE